MIVFVAPWEQRAPGDLIHLIGPVDSYPVPVPRSLKWLRSMGDTGQVIFPGPHT